MKKIMVGALLLIAVCFSIYAMIGRYSKEELEALEQKFRKKEEAEDRRIMDDIRRRQEQAAERRKQMPQETDEQVEAFLALLNLKKKQEPK